jgi:hypothetical protein
MNPRAVRILHHDEDFRILRFRCHQIYYVGDFAAAQLTIPISISSLARAFGYDRNRVSQALAHGLEPQEARGRHSALDADVERELALWIEENASKSTAATARDARAYISSHYNVAVTRGLVNSFLLRNSDRFCQMKSVPQETPRLEVPHCFFDEIIR